MTPLLRRRDTLRYTIAALPMTAAVFYEATHAMLMLPILLLMLAAAEASG